MPRHPILGFPGEAEARERGGRTVTASNSRISGSPSTLQRACQAALDRKFAADLASSGGYAASKGSHSCDSRPM